MNDDFQIFISGGKTIIARKLTGNFPDYERVIPKGEGICSIPLQTTPLLKLLKRVSVFTDSRSKAFRLTLTKGLLTLSAGMSECGTSSGSLPCEWQGAEWQSGFNAGYLEEFLKQAPEEIMFRFRKPNDEAAMFTVEGYSYLLMPMRM